MSFSNDDFRITDATTGQQAFFVAEKMVSLREQKTLYDSSTSSDRLQCTTAVVLVMIVNGEQDDIIVVTFVQDHVG